MAIIERNISGITELVQGVLEIADAIPDGNFLWFRGLSCSSHTLLPSLLRDNKSSEQVFDREKRLLTRFRQRSMAYWPSGYPQNDWEHLFAMQHFGMPTRLLDWSENIFVAAHFALAGKHEPHHIPGETEALCTPVIWIVDPISWNRTTPLLSEYGDEIQVLTTADELLESYRPESTKRRGKSPVAMFGAHNSARIVAQRGTFMVWGEGTRSLEDIATENQDIKLWKFILSGDRNEYSKALIKLGFSETMVFPELPSLSAELTRSEGWKNVDR